MGKIPLAIWRETRYADNREKYPARPGLWGKPNCLERMCSECENFAEIHKVTGETSAKSINNPDFFTESDELSWSICRGKQKVFPAEEKQSCFVFPVGCVIELKVFFQKLIKEGVFQ